MPPSSLDPSSFLICEFPSLIIPLLSRMSNLSLSLPHPSPQPTNMPKVLTSPETSNYPATIAPLAFSSQPVPLPPKAWPADQQHQPQMGARRKCNSQTHPWPTESKPLCVRGSKVCAVTRAAGDSEAHPRSTILDRLPLSLSCLTPQGSVLASFLLELHPFPKWSHPPKGWLGYLSV